MKTVKIIIVALMAIALGSNSHAQSSTSKTETIKVAGNCEMCKARIEKAAKLDGVSKAEWSTKTKTLSVTFNPSKTNIELVGKKVTVAGHDTEKVKATDAVYDKLPGCCKYR